ncbi:ABC transporter substrate binding protein [Pseudodesulfovibrio senegalensis]|uniref:histidine kinase n=1 Tax=Pseudodesulfovibrio senegalensis TaxID=1721087 RepID=A0A6N6N7C3_9BACT|nr:ABC transporter substrate binding protein [Pseudodesulfovibrio senegalensis]KAB1443325.1 response regulator [Pseudodesulfovibrio senegalensis]
MRNYIFILVVLLLLPAQAAWAQKPKKKVLYLNSYHHGYAWSDEIRKGIISVLNDSEFTLEVQTEYMDAKKYNYNYITNKLVTLYRDKFAGEKFDAIIVSDNDAFSFVRQHRAELFPGVPIVFCGVNMSRDPLEVGITGVVERPSIIDTLNVALSFHPGVKRLVVVGDESTTGRYIRQQIENVMSVFEKRLAFEYWTNMGMGEMLTRVRELPDDTILFFIPMYQEVDGRFYTAEEVMEEISKYSTVPLYSSWRFLLGHGSVGGKLLSGQDQGAQAAEMALEVLRGTPVSSIPIVDKPSGEYWFDYKVLKRLHIPEDMLPKGSKLINTPKAFYELPKELFWTIIVSLGILLVITVFLVTNIHERKKGEKKIMDQLSFLEILMDTIPQLVCWKDENQRYLGANRAFTSFFGLERPSSIVSKSDLALLDHTREYAEWANSLDREVFRTRKSVTKARTKVQDLLGNTVWLEITKVPLFDRLGQVVGTLSTAENITKQLSLEKQLLQSQKMEAIGTLAGGIAHDFNNILTSIINSTELAISDVTENSVTQKDLNRVLKAAQRGGNVVKQILAFSRPSQEGFRPTDMGELLYEVLGLVKASLPRNIDIRTDIQTGLNSVNADPTQLHQVVLNLCTNSFQALRASGGVLKVELAEVELGLDDARMLNLRPDTYLKLSISDNGPGIPMDILDKIFDPFFTTKDKTEGTGLGLAVVHGIVKGHNGAITVSSSPWDNTRFDIYLPSNEKLDESGSIPLHKLAPGVGRILFVEDDEDQLQTTPRILESLGYDVVATSDPMEVIGMVARDPYVFDLVITDFDMPDTNGVELALSLQDTAPHLPVMLVSGREDAATAASRLKNIKRVVIKPYNKNIIAEAIDSVLGS